MLTPRFTPVSASQSWVAHLPDVNEQAAVGAELRVPVSPTRHPRRESK